MPAKPTPVRVQRAATEVGEHLGAWRRMLNLTAVQVAERANISRDTLRRLEHGDPAVSFFATFVPLVAIVGGMPSFAPTSISSIKPL